MLENLWCQRNDFHVNCTELTGYRTENTASAKFSCIIQQHTSIIVKTDV
ncbi:unknown [Prevotella sp. CAG:1124]|nr:unknown [Prevotella sp. CAG:1124]